MNESGNATSQAPSSVDAVSSQTVSEGMPAAGTPTSGGQTLPWTHGLNEDHKSFVTTKGFKDTSSIVDSYRNLEKLVGAKEKLVKLPDSEDSPEWSHIYNKLGRPETPDNYNLKFSEQTSKDFVDWAKNTFHNLGLSSGQAAKLSDQWTQYVSNQEAQISGNYQAKNIQEQDSLKSEWGAAFEQNVNVAKQAARSFGLDASTIDKLEDAMGFAGAIKLMHTLGSRVGEGSYVSSNSAGSTSPFGVMTPASAQQRLTELRSDPEFVRKYTKGDTYAKQEMEKLHRWAYPQ